MTDDDTGLLHAQMLSLEREGLVTRTFRRLDPERQLAVVEAILEEAAEKGPSAIAVRSVAGRAGVAVGSLYKYFPDRDGMLAVAATLSGHFLSAALEQYSPYLAAMPLRRALGAYLEGGVEWSRMHAGLLRFFARAAYQGDTECTAEVVAPLAASMLGVVRGMLAAAQERGELRADVDLQWAARLVNALTIVVGDSQLLPYLNVYFQVVPEDGRPEEATAAAIDFVMAAVTNEGVGRP